MPFRSRLRALAPFVAAPLLAALPGAAGAQDASSDDDPRARALVDGWVEALGGMETYHGFRSARFTLTTELYDPATGRLRRARPRYVTLAKMGGDELARIERWTWSGDPFVVQGFDGEEAWAYVNGERAPSGHRDAEQAIYVCRDVFYWFSLPYKLTDPGVRLHHDGTDEEGREVVRVTFGEGVGEHQDVWWYLFDGEKSWPVEVRYREEGVESVDRLYWEDFRSVDGYVYPGRRVHVDERDRVTKVLAMSDVRLNPDVRAAHFSDPDASPWTEEP